MTARQTKPARTRRRVDGRAAGRCVRETAAPAAARYSGHPSCDSGHHPARPPLEVEGAHEPDRASCGELLGLDQRAVHPLGQL